MAQRVLDDKRLLVSLLAVASLALVGTIALIEPVRAHKPSAFYPAPYPPDRTRLDFYFDQSVPRGLWRDRIVGASRQWNKLNGRLSFRAHRSNLDDRRKKTPASCTPQRINDDFDSIIYRRRYEDSRYLAYTAQCQGTGKRPRWFYMSFNSRIKYWTGRSQTIPVRSDRKVHDLQSAAAHEFGHATGFKGSHYREKPRTDTNDICTVRPAQHAMCAGLSAYTTWQRTLERHDRHTFEGAY